MQWQGDSLTGLRGTLGGRSLQVVIVGAGIGGLTAAVALRLLGHRVVVLEQAKELREVGAGVQLHPNATRVLLELGLRQFITPFAVVPHRATQRRWENGKVLSDLTLGDVIEEKYGAPYWHLHRADLHSALHAVSLAQEAPGFPVDLRLGARVRSVEADPERARVYVEGEPDPIVGDVVIGADGLHSVVRAMLFGPTDPIYSGEVIYRGFIPRAVLDADSGMREVAADPAMVMWMGPGRHVVHYLVHRAELCNFAFVVRAEEGVATESWSARGEAKKMEEELSGWDDRLRRMAASVENVHVWALYDREPLKAGATGNVCLLGDAYHPMLPYQSQGAGQAIEDAAVLAVVLSGDCDITDALSLYDSLRREHTSQVQGASRDNGRRYHLDDGPEQEQRDEQLGQQSGRYYERPEIWAYDALAEARKALAMAPRGAKREGTER